MKDNSFDLEINKIIYQFNIDLEDQSNIEFSYYIIFKHNNCSINKKKLETTLKNLLSFNDDNHTLKIDQESLLIDQIDDHMQFIEVILFSSQVEKALYQLAKILWNNLWILKKNYYLELKVKDFFVKLFEKHQISSYIYFLIFNYQSSREKIESSESQIIDFDINIDDIDYELDNINYSEYKEDNEFNLDFFFN